LSVILAIPRTASFFLVTVLAQLWEPLAVDRVIRHLGANLNPTPAAVTSALRDAVKFIDAEMRAQSPMAQAMHVRAAMQKASGSQNLFGPAALALRLGMIQRPRGTGKIWLGLGRDSRYDWTPQDEATQRLRLLSQAAVAAELRQPQQLLDGALENNTIWDLSATLDANLMTLPRWAQMKESKPSSARPHVVWKATLWLHQHFAANPQDAWPRDHWKRLCPDEGRHLHRIPADWSMARVRLIARKLHVNHFGMWCGLLTAAQSFPGAKVWFSRDPSLVAQQWHAAFLDLRMRAEHHKFAAPTCLQITVRAMEMHPV